MGSKRPANRGQKRAAKSKARARRQQSSGPTNPTAAALVDILASTIDDFTQWMKSGEMAGEAEQISHLAHSTLKQLANAQQMFTPDALKPSDAHLIVEAAERITEADTEEALDTADNLVLSMLAYLTFLDETNLWTGTEEDFAHCMEDLTDFLEGEQPDLLVPDDVELPELTVDEELAALTALPLLSALDDILARVGSGTTVAGLPELAAGLADEPVEPQTSPDPAMALEYWQTAVATDLIRIDGNDVARGSNADSFAARGAETLHDIAAEHIRVQLSAAEPGEDIAMSLANSFAVQTLLAAMTDDLPINNDAVEYDDLEDEDLRTAQLIDYRVKSLIAQGFLVPHDVALQVPAALRPAVLDGVAEAEPFGPEDEPTL